MAAASGKGGTGKTTVALGLDTVRLHRETDLLPHHLARNAGK